MRVLAALLTFSCTVTQSATGSPLRTGALAFGLHDHEHSVSILADRGHVDLVLSHDESGHDHDAPPPDGPRWLSESDHVVHLASDDGEATLRRGAVPPPTLSHAAPFPVPAVARIFLPAPEPRARGAHHLRIVLRL